MAKISLKGTDVTTSGDIPQKGEKAPNFKLVATDLQEVNLENYTGKKKVLKYFAFRVSYLSFCTSLYFGRR